MTSSHKCNWNIAILPVAWPANAGSALLKNPLPDRSNRHFATPTTSLPPIYFTIIIVSSGKTLLQRFAAESSRELSALRKLNNKQRQVSMFLFKLLTQFPFSILSLLPFSILSLLPLSHPFFVIKTSSWISSFITFCFTNGTFFCILFHTMTFF